MLQHHDCQLQCSCCVITCSRMNLFYARFTSVIIGRGTRMMQQMHQTSKDEANTTVGNCPNCTKDATSDNPRNKRQKKSSNPTPAPSDFTQQQPQQYAPQIPSPEPSSSTAGANLSTKFGYLLPTEPSSISPSPKSQLLSEPSTCTTAALQPVICRSVTTPASSSSLRFPWSSSWILQ